MFETLLLWVGRLAALIGVSVCAVAIVVRLSGAYAIGGVWAVTILQGGMALLLISCTCLLLALTARK